MNKTYSILLFISVILLSSCSRNLETDDSAELMKKFIAEIAIYSRSKKSDFILIQQNGAELATVETDNWSEIDIDYLKIIDALCVEELFFFYEEQIDEERLSLLRRLKANLPVIVSDIVKSDSYLQRALSLITSENFVPFIRDSANYYYEKMPKFIYQENSLDINSIADVKNVLYYIGGASTYQNKKDYLNAIKNTNFDLVIIDLFFNGQRLTKDDVSSLKMKANGAKRLVVSYISIGSAERYRYYWRSYWKPGNPSFIRKPYSGYPDEFYVAYWDKEWKKIIYGSEQSYIDRIIASGFDGAFLDNVEAYYYLYYD